MWRHVREGGYKQPPLLRGQQISVHQHPSTTTSIHSRGEHKAASSEWHPKTLYNTYTTMKIQAKQKKSTHANNQHRKEKYLHQIENKTFQQKNRMQNIFIDLNNIKVNRP
jgi:hypothetical protein